MFESAWEQDGNLTPEETAQIFKRMYLDIQEERDCMIGEIRAFLRSELPVGILPCDGSTFERVDYPRLYELIPPAFHLDADHFRTPDLRRRGLFGSGDSGEFGDIDLGDFAGSESQTLEVANLAEHTHTTNPHTHTDAGHSHTYSAPIADLPGVSPGEVVFSVPNPFPGLTGTGFAAIQPETVEVNATGEGEPFEILNPVMGVTWGIVAL